MSESTRADRERQRTRKKDEEKPALPEHWRQIHGAIWLIGLAILAWQGWWWPGILILVAISSVTETGIRLYLSRAEQERTQQQERIQSVPATCPNCGSPLSTDTVRWSNDGSARCPFCGSRVGAQ